MGRTNVIVDEELIQRVMELYGLKTKREAIDYALRSLATKRERNRKLLKLRGIGWEGDLDEMRRARTFE